MADPEHVRILHQGATAWNEWRSQHSDQPNLCEAIFGGILDGANFKGANLREAIFYGAGLAGGDFTGADLHGALLVNADLRGANLREANLHRAALHGTILSEGDLNGADFSEAEFLETVVANVDLSVCKNLNLIKHLGPSSVDIRTLQRSGRLPLSFLRGVGLPDNLIGYLPSLFGSVIEFYSCFISYSHDDKVFARRLHDQLQGLGIRCWLDEHQLLPGDDMHEGVDRGIKLWDKVLLCASTASLKSWWVDGEINRAFQKEAQRMKERGNKVLALIPLNLDGHLFHWESGKAAEVRARLAADFRGWETNNTIFETQFDRLVRALRTDDGGREPPPRSRL